ncbi:MAG: hypothetical protein E6G14_12265 [Actinobacteria bacterium]|nr:MAG: hypothetical protein E6G14_12265 [Actinomycetota bacterium]
MFFNPTAVSGSFRVDASSSGADSIEFPDVFVVGDGGSVSGSSASKTYSWSTGAAPLTLSFAVTASNTGGQSDPVSFTVSPDSTAPASSISCSPGPCGGGTGTQSVTLSATDSSGSGVKAIHFTTNGTTPTLGSPVYTSPLSVSSTTTVKFFAVDNVGNTEAVQTQTITITSGGGASFVRQTTNLSASASSLATSLSPASTSGNTLVAIIAFATGSSASVSSVSDSGGAWTKGPVGFLTGINSRVEIWYRLSAPAVSSVTVTLSSAKAVAVNISEWSGVTGFERSSNGNGSSSTTITTPPVTTTNAQDLVIAATNYPSGATSTLTSGSFASLQDFNSGSGVHGRAAYVITSSTGTFQASWSLSTSSGGHGTAIIAFKAS